jgi:hypothetical protein
MNGVDARSSQGEPGAGGERDHQQIPGAGVQVHEEQQQ